MVEGLAADLVGLRSLVVDDRADNRDLLAELLGQWGFDVRTAENGEAALEIWEAWAPRVVWMDLIMPGMGGCEAVARIRAQEADSGRNRTLVIALSASVLDADRESLREQGFDEFVIKPFRESEIREPLERLGGLRFGTTNLGDSTPRPTLSAQRLQALPEDWRRSFQKTLLLGDLDQALLLVIELGADPLAEELRAMVRDYRSEELLHMMEE
jgi:CheY-like chemotaxis protein